MLLTFTRYTDRERSHSREEAELTIGGTFGVSPSGDKAVPQRSSP